MIADDMDFDDPPPRRRPLFRRKRVWIPLGVLLVIVVGFLLLLTPDTDRDAMIAKSGGPNAPFAARPAGHRIRSRAMAMADRSAIIRLHAQLGPAHCRNNESHDGQIIEV